MFLRSLLIATIVAISSAFSFKMGLGNKIAASVIGGSMILMPFASNAENLLEKKAKFSIGAGIQQSSVINEKKAKFSIGAGIQKKAKVRTNKSFSPFSLLVNNN